MELAARREPGVAGHAVRAGLAGLALLLGGCGPLLIDPDLQAAEGKVMVVWIGSEADVARSCALDFNLPGSAACVSMAQSPEQSAAMLEQWAAELRRRGKGLDCIIASPAALAALGHEMTLCGKQPAWYWNKAVAGAAP